MEGSWQRDKRERKKEGCIISMVVTVAIQGRWACNDPRAQGSGVGG